MTDVLLRQSPDGGEITLPSVMLNAFSQSIQAGLVLMTDGLETATYLSLFGGNAEDPGHGPSDQQYWGNLLETIPARQYRSETQFLLKSLPLVPANLRRIEQAASRDLAWMLEDALVKSVTVVASIPTINRVVIEITLITLTQQIQLSFG